MNSDKHFWNDRDVWGSSVKKKLPPTYDLNRFGCEAWDEEPATSREVDGLINHFERATRHSGFLDPKSNAWDGTVTPTIQPCACGSC